MKADIIEWGLGCRYDRSLVRCDGAVDVRNNNVGDVAREQMSWRDITEESIDHVLAVDMDTTWWALDRFTARSLAGTRPHR
jgi:3-oxoacyl-[acyl-carrier protein] reductase